jgi:hypothetical protein
MNGIGDACLVIFFSFFFFLEGRYSLFYLLPSWAPVDSSLPNFDNPFINS